jgi:malate dehydrogenase (oxaloacetate-decarboxylating)(NADP+)
MKEGQATKLDSKHFDDLESFVQSKMYDPVYVPLVEKREISI